MTTFSETLATVVAERATDLPPTFGGGDPTDSLPPASRQKLERAQADRDGAVAVYQAASDVWRELWSEAGRTEAFARSRLDLPAGVDFHHPAAAVVDELRRQRQRTETEQRILAPVDAAKARLAAAADARDRAAENQSRHAFVANIEGWVAANARPGVVFEMVPAASVGRVKDAIAAVAQARDELSAIDEAFAAAETAPLPAAELRARAIAEIGAAAGDLRLAIRSRGHTPLNLSSRLALSAHAGTNNSTNIVGDAGARLFTMLLRERLVEEVDNAIAGADFSGALSDTDRDARFSELAARRLDLERREESLIQLAEQDGRVVTRRPDLDARAFLGIEA